MNKKISFILKTLNNLFPDPEVPLKHWTNHFQLLIAVLLSGHSTDKATNNVTKILFEQVKTPSDCISLGQENLRLLIKNVGLSQKKSFFIYELSKVIKIKFHDNIPSNLEDLTSLPGVGRKTANVVLSQGFRQNTFPVDTHIVRLANRWGLSLSTNPLRVEKDLIKCFPTHTFFDLHIQLILYGRKHCPARFHKLENCPVCFFLKRKS